MIDITTKFAGLNLKSPIIIGSCGLTGSSKYLKSFEENGAGAIVLKSIFEEEIIFEYEKYSADAQKFGYDGENLDYFDLKIKQDNINSYIKLIKEAKKTVKIPIIASINCISEYEWISFTKKIEEAGADALELNIFLQPNEPNKTSQEIEDLYIHIIESVKKVIKIPLIIKMSQYFTNLLQMIQKVAKTGVDGIVLFNRFFNPDISINSKEIKSADIFSSPDKISLPLRWIAVSSGKINTTLAASTGIHDGEGLVKMLLVGVDAVEIVSTIYLNGANQIDKMISYLNNYLIKNNLDSISQIKGLLKQENIKNPALFERIQFMKYFSDHDDVL